MCGKKTVIVTGGPIYPEASALISEDDLVICADSGVDFCRANNIRIDKVYGDLDSISEEGKNYIRVKAVPLETFPVEKDMTDTELALRTVDKSTDILLICSLEGRPDHVVTNVALISRLREEGFSLIASDGITDIIPLAGTDEITIKDIFDASGKAVSLIPMCEEVTGVTTGGLYYELSDATLKFGSSYSTSNEIRAGEDSFSVSIKSGRLLVYITERV